MSKFTIGVFKFKRKKDAILEYRRLSYLHFLNFEESCKVISLACYNPIFKNKIGENARNVKEVYGNKGLWIKLKSGEILRVPVALLINLSYSQNKVVREYLKVKGLRHFKKACKSLIRGVSAKTIEEFIEWAKLKPQEIMYTDGEKGLYHFIDEDLKNIFIQYCKVRENHSYRAFYMACRTAIYKERPTKKGREAHHANEGGFTKIVQDFISENNIILDEVEYLPYKQVICFKDNNMRDNFIKYHNSHVIWEMLTPLEHKRLHSTQPILTLG